MSLSLSCGVVRDAMLAQARERSIDDELRCHALLGLVRAANSLQLAIQSGRGPDALTESGFCVLAYLIHGKPVCALRSKVAGALGVSPPALARTLGRLEISGLIVRQRTPRSGRSMAFGVTAAGRRAFGAALSHYVEAMTEMMSSLEAKEVATLDHASARLLEVSSPTAP